jgi:hypothetical protein
LQEVGGVGVVLEVDESNDLEEVVVGAEKTKTEVTPVLEESISDKVTEVIEEVKVVENELDCLGERFVDLKLLGRQEKKDEVMSESEVENRFRLDAMKAVGKSFTIKIVYNLPRLN